MTLNDPLVERRGDYGGLKQSIALIQQDLEYIKKSLDQTNTAFSARIKECETMKERTYHIDRLDREFKGHVIADRFMFGLIITLILGLFGKMMIS